MMVFMRNLPVAMWGKPHPHPAARWLSLPPFPPHTHKHTHPHAHPSPCQPRCCAGARRAARVAAANAVMAAAVAEASSSSSSSSSPSSSLAAAEATGPASPSTSPASPSLPGPSDCTAGGHGLGMGPHAAEGSGQGADAPAGAASTHTLGREAGGDSGASDGGRTAGGRGPRGVKGPVEDDEGEEGEDEARDDEEEGEEGPAVVAGQVGGWRSAGLARQAVECDDAGDDGHHGAPCCMSACAGLGLGAHWGMPRFGPRASTLLDASPHTAWQHAARLGCAPQHACMDCWWLFYCPLPLHA